MADTLARSALEELNDLRSLTDSSLLFLLQIPDAALGGVEGRWPDRVLICDGVRENGLV